MANPEAVMRAAQAGPKPMMGGGMPPGGAPDMPPAPSATPKPPEAAGGLDQMVETLQSVGSFLQSQGPAGQRAMGHFQALVQEMAQMGGGAPQGEPPEPGRIHESQAPGVRVL